jgi:alkanesulfonate monooxygenase SsuD/methylene tetrahydromethanopterin reductase-like flavin-dependent oxidoreductase (luciferase family)
MSAIGTNTKRISLSTGVTDIQRIHPAKTAHIIATLDELTKGRAVLAIGAGEVMNIEPYGMEWDPPSARAERLKEAVRIIKMLWKSSRSNPVSFEGKFYKLNKAWLDQAPFRNHTPPVYIGSLGSQRTLKLVGEVGDGWFPWFNTLDTFKKRTQIIREAASSAGRKMQGIDLCVLLFTAVTSNDQIRKRAISALKAEILVLNHRNVLKDLGYRFTVPQDFDYSYQHVLATEDAAAIAAKAAEAMPDDVATQFMASGDVDDCLETVAKFVESGATHIALRDVVGQYLYGSVQKAEATLRAFKRRIIPYFDVVDESY